MKKIITLLFVFVAMFTAISVNAQKRKTVVTIENDKFFINNKPTLQGKTWNGYPIEGLLPNSRMVQAIFDDENPVTRQLWAYPDTKVWDEERNTDEFIKAMPEWYSYGLLAVTLNLQGGSPTGYGNKGWKNSALDSLGNLKPAYFKRLEKVLDAADNLGMVVILGIFYFGQDEFITNEAAVINGVNNTMDWLFKKRYRNILIEVANECNLKSYNHDIIRDARIHELINLVKSKKEHGYRFYVGTSFSGAKIPAPNVVKASDFILIHGNSVKDPKIIADMVKQTRAVEGYMPMPIVFNEDDHYDFDKPENNFVVATQHYASWGFFDYRRKDEPFQEGYQSVPVDWGINSERKKAFFNKLKEITGGNIVSYK